MNDFPFGLVGFDLDGTLVDSVADLAAAVNHALAEIGRPPLTIEQVRPMIGGGSRVMLQQALTATGGDERLDDLLPEMLAFYAAHIVDHTRPFPGVLEALDALRKLGITLAVVTNKRERFSLALLDALGLTDRFSCIIGGDTPGLVAMKPDRAPIDLLLRKCGNSGPAAFVGDSIYDVDAARAAGVPVALFAPDGGGVPGANAVFADYRDLLPTLTRMAKAQPTI
ncbi:HAD-IA family hydrolase [Sphingomonas asaccharolytica]|uniref:HAD-IA family hydrolase n=1 Tax=Sphingomonas asaccharolytica TaxID=40681 RepID=UPI000832863B|nr:HAD-IA family hydrolase [Sphingomonas asaccharolytica]